MEYNFGLSRRDLKSLIEHMDQDFVFTLHGMIGDDDEDVLVTVNLFPTNEDEESDFWAGALEEHVTIIGSSDGHDPR